jgi:hypothetical protein
MQGIKRAHWELKRKQAYGVWDIFNASKDSVAWYYNSCRGRDSNLELLRE